MLTAEVTEEICFDHKATIIQPGSLRITDWMHASRLRLNPAKTEVMWLGSHQQLKKVDITDVYRCKLEDVNLGVVLDSQLSLSSHVAALYRAGFFHIRQLRPAIQSMTNRYRQNSSPGFHLLPSRLLQLFGVQYVRRPFSEDPVDPERRRTSGHRDSSMRSYHASAASIALAFCSSKS